MTDTSEGQCRGHLCGTVDRKAKRFRADQGDTSSWKAGGYGRHNKGDREKRPEK